MNDVLHAVKRLQQCLETLRVDVVLHVDVHVKVAHDDNRASVRRAKLFQHSGQFVEERRTGNIRAGSVDSQQQEVVGGHMTAQMLE